MKQKIIRADARGMDMRKWIAVLGAIALAATVGAQEASEDEEAVKNVAGQWVAAWNAGDMTAVGDLYTDDSDYVDIFGATHKGRAAIEASFTELHSTAFKGTTLSTKSTAVHFLKPDLAVSDSEWEMGNMPKTDGPAPASKGQATVVVARQDDGQWKIVAHRSRIPQSAVPPPAE